MGIKNLSEGNIKLLKEMYKKGSITSASQDIYCGIGFYGAKDFLLKKGLIDSNGVNDKNQLIFKLTPKGKKLVELVVEIEKLLEIQGDELNV